MYVVTNKAVLVVGLGRSGVAAARFLAEGGANVAAIDEADTAELRHDAEQLRKLGVTAQLGIHSAPVQAFDLAVLSPGVPLRGKLVQELFGRGIPVIGELELGFQHARCLCLA